MLANALNALVEPLAHRRTRFKSTHAMLLIFIVVISHRTIPNAAAFALGACSVGNMVVQAGTAAIRTGGCHRALAVSSREDIDRVQSATRAWIEEFVIGLSLCPWAQLTNGLAPSGAPRTRIVTVPGSGECMESHASAVLREAESLRRCPGGGTYGFSTTLLVFPDAAYRGKGPGDCGDFPKLVRHIQRLLDQEPGPDRIDLLAFHRFRADEGPGTRDDVEDAAHFSVRSPSSPHLNPQDIGYRGGGAGRRLEESRV